MIAPRVHAPLGASFLGRCGGRCLGDRLILLIAVKPQLSDQRRHLRATAQPQSIEHLRDMVRDRSRRQYESFGYLVIAEAVGDQNGDLELASCELPEHSFERLAPPTFLGLLY